MKAILDMAGKVWEAEGKTAAEAFQALPIKIIDIKLKGILTLQDGKKKTSRVIMSNGLKRFAANKFIRIQTAKNFEKVLSKNDEPQLYKIIK